MFLSSTGQKMGKLSIHQTFAKLKTLVVGGGHANQHNAKNVNLNYGPAKAWEVLH